MGLRSVENLPVGCHSELVNKAVLCDMLRHMRTTIRLKDDLLRRARKRAADEGRTLTSLIEEGLSLILAKQKPSRREQIKLPVSKASGGVLPGIDLNHSSDLEEVMNTP